MMECMKKIFKPDAAILAAAFVMLLPGCGRDETGADSERTPVKVATRAAIGSEIDGVTLNSVRIIAVDDTGYVAFNEYRDADSDDLGFVDGELGELTAGNFIVSILPGTYDFYAVVNELSAQRAALDAAKGLSALKAIKLSASDIPSEADMVCVGEAAGVRVIPAADEDSHAMVSIGGATATERLNIPVVRAVTKLTVKVRKQTADALDSFSIKGAELSNVPEYSYLLPQTYDGTLRQNVDISPETAVAFTANSDVYSEVSTGYVMPEYLMATPTGSANATRLVLTADYTTAGGSSFSDVEYGMTLLKGVDEDGIAIDNFNMVRGTHYVVNVTIEKLGGFDYYIEYEVAKWDKVTDDPSNVTIGDDFYQFSGKWADGTVTEDNGDVALVRLNESVTMEFTLSRPTSGTWTAQLSNPDDFYFDLSSGGVRSGVARPGFINKIVVSPRRGTSSSNVSTEIYINISNGVNEIECDLVNDEGTQPGKRYVIKQIPNM